MQDFNDCSRRSTFNGSSSHNVQSSSSATRTETIPEHRPEGRSIGIVRQKLVVQTPRNQKLSEASNIKSFYLSSDIPQKKNLGFLKPGDFP